MSRASGGLTKWYKQNWVDIGTRKKDAKRKYPKCVPLAKAKRMSASQRAAAVSRKRSAEKKPRTGKKPNYART